jgi:hypothetical protein
MKTSSDAMAVLSAMITPAVLILGTSSLIAATSARLGRLLDRIRKLVEHLEAALDRTVSDRHVAKCDLLRTQLTRSAVRAWLLQYAMTSLYLALGAFVSTSVALGIDAAFGLGHVRLLAFLGLVGVVLLLTASVLLIAESRVAILAVNHEIAFVIELGTKEGCGNALTPAVTSSKVGEPKN